MVEINVTFSILIADEKLAHKMVDKMKQNMEQSMSNEVSQGHQQDTLIQMLPKEVREKEVVVTEFNINPNRQHPSHTMGSPVSMNTPNAEISVMIRTLGAVK